MGLQINPQSPFFGGLRRINDASNRLQRTFEGLATAQRINRARDDAAGLAIAERFRSEVRQFNVEARNLQDGVSFLRTAEGGLATQQDAVGRIEELALQAANGTLTDDQRAAINEEAQLLLEQIDDTAETTEFNGRRPLQDGEDLPVGVEGGDEINVNESTTATLGLAGIDLSTQAGAESALGALQNASNQISQERGSLGAQENRLTRAIGVREVAAENSAASESAIRDLDFAQATINQSRDEILLQGAIAAAAQGNIAPQNALNLLRNIS